ncbi:MAG: hypothetical protein SH848_01710 [Saprospiraceae bacterium]|nr:hypothetical protein [Saprospiraceae bacterium]MDZ4702613.1 hypothetical protein [Saprospiraceae bacterium]
MNQSSNKNAVSFIINPENNKIGKLFILAFQNFGRFLTMSKTSGTAEISSKRMYNYAEIFQAPYVIRARTNPAHFQCPEEHFCQ